MGQFAIQLLETGKTEDETMKQGQENAGRGDLRIGAGVGHAVCMRAQIEALVQPGGKGR